MPGYELPEPILNSPFAEQVERWNAEERPAPFEAGERGQIEANVVGDRGDERMVAKKNLKKAHYRP